MAMLAGSSSDADPGSDSLPPAKLSYGAIFAATSTSLLASLDNTNAATAEEDTKQSDSKLTNRGFFMLPSLPSGSIIKKNKCKLTVIKQAQGKTEESLSNRCLFSLHKKSHRYFGGESVILLSFYIERHRFLFRCIIRSFDSDPHIVRMALFQAVVGDADETRFGR